MRTVASAMHVIPYMTIPGTEARTELDTHADTCCVGANFTPLVFTGETVDVTPFTDHYEATKDVPVVSAATM